MTASRAPLVAPTRVDLARDHRDVEIDGCPGLTCASARVSRLTVALLRPPAYNALVDLTALSNIELCDSSDAPRRLGSFWAERPIVLAFLRHFG